MKVYLLIQDRTLCVQGYEVGTESYVCGVYSTHQKAAKAMYEMDDDPYVNYRIIEKEVIK